MVDFPWRRSRRLQGLSPKNPLNPLTQPPMEIYMENHFEEGIDYFLYMEVIPVEEEVVEYPPPNSPLTYLSGPPLAERTSSRNAYFVVLTPSGVGIH